MKKQMNPNEIRNSFLSFMEKKGAKRIPSSSLLPENDPTTLFTGSGMQPMIPYLLGQPHPQGEHIVNVQKCLRTVDIDEVGDCCHLTLFEMVGRWQFQGDKDSYKRLQIESIWEWQIEELGLNPEHLYITVYRGDEERSLSQDDETIGIWQGLFEKAGLEAKVENDPFQYGASRGARIFLYDDKENWWSRSGPPENMPNGEPGGPDSEMFFDFTPNGDPLDHPAVSVDRFIEIGNNVFMCFKKHENGLSEISAPNIDYGGGLERIASAVNGNPDIFQTAFFVNPMKVLREITGCTYSDFEKEFRIILDHTRASTFLIGDEALPSNTDAGYITRRLMRRAIRTARQLGVTRPFMSRLAEVYIDEAHVYPDLQEKKELILKAITNEEMQFQKTIDKGEREISKCLEKNDTVTGKDAFYLYETYGFPLELTQEVLKEQGKELIDPEGFSIAEEEHSRKSRLASSGKFQGGLADHSEKTTAFHTATHLLLAGLQKVLGDHIHQKGSNITPERARFDFSHDKKMTTEEKQAVEQYVNDAIAAQAEMTICEMSKDTAKETNVEGSFWDRYPDVVSVYTFEDCNGDVWSREICGGPHVNNTSMLAQFGEFKIKKEESCAAGTRRIKGIFID